MHEHHFIENIIKNIPNKDNINSVEIEVGELAGIEPVHLKEHLEEHTGWKVKCIAKNSRVTCSCGFDGKPRILQRLHDLVIYECPDCGNNVDVKEGSEIKIIKVFYKD
jgi:Zn finger protein HypA/HybF involved in hydrogenase expression